MYRVLKPGTFCLSFYGWNVADKFIAAWRAAGFRIVGHVVFRKRYASSARFLRYEHECAYLLAKGEVELPEDAPSDVVDWVYTGNRLHPTQKSAEMLKPLVQAFCVPGGVVLDPFCGSGSSLVAARELGRRFYRHRVGSAALSHGSNAHADARCMRRLEHAREDCSEYLFRLSNALKMARP